MSKKTLIFFAAFFTLSAVLPALAQSQTQSQSQSVTPELSSSSLDLQGIKKYLLGPGDLLDVRVFGQPDLNSTVEIDSEGNISSLPFIEEPLPAMCRSEKDVQKSITEAYSKYLRKPRVSVRILERRSRPPASIFGAVRAPTRVQMMRRVRLHELLALSGGITGGASGTIQIMHTEPEMCVDVEVGAKTAKSEAGFDSQIGQLEVYKINTLKAGGFTVEAGTLGQSDPFIRPGDIVIVTEGLPIYITGAVVSPREIVMKDQITLARALAMAGGVQRLAKAHEIHIYRQKGEGQLGQNDMKVDYQAIKDGKKPDVLLQPYDIIDVRMQGTFSPKSLGDFFLNMGRGSMGILPTRVIP